MSTRSTTTATSTRSSSTSKERGRTLGTKARTTIEPGKVLEVDDAELVDLHRQRLLHSFERSDTTNTLGLGKSPNRWRGGDVEVVDSGIITDSDGGDDDEADEGDDTESEGSK